jgi:hypothetical protein
MHKNILRELEGFQLAIEVVKSLSFSSSSGWLGVASSFVPLDGIFNLGVAP